jgi:hypothetical protein
MAYWMNYPDPDLEAVRNTKNTQGRIPHNLAGILNGYPVSTELQHTLLQPPSQQFQINFHLSFEVLCNTSKDHKSLGNNAPNTITQSLSLTCAHVHTHTHIKKSALCKLMNKKEDPHCTECNYLQNVPIQIVLNTGLAKSH